MSLLGAGALYMCVGGGSSNSSLTSLFSTSSFSFDSKDSQIVIINPSTTKVSYKINLDKTFSTP